MASFRDSPPSIPSFDWNNLYHRTSLVSCLVKGVYRMERNRQGSAPPAKIWWDCYGFTLCKPLTDAEDDSIYGAVFQNIDNYQNTPNSNVSPRYVIAFRGTIRERQTIVADVKLGIRCVLQNLHQGARSVQAIQEVQNYVDKYGNAAVWIAGHSLGAGLALLAGKTMAISGSPVEAYIFNPPVITFIRSKQLSGDVARVTRDIFKAFIAIFIEDLKEDLHKKLASWRPYLFVNQSDPICSGYIDYFKHKVKMGELGLRGIESSASSYSFRSLLFGGGESSSPYSSREHIYFLLSGSMMVNTDKSPTFNHGIHQWWNPKLQCVSYQINIFGDGEPDIDRDRQEMPLLNLDMVERIIRDAYITEDDEWVVGNGPEGYVAVQYYVTDIDEADMGEDEEENFHVPPDTEEPTQREVNPNVNVIGQGSRSTEISEKFLMAYERRSEAIKSAGEAKGSDRERAVRRIHQLSNIEYNSSFYWDVISLIEDKESARQMILGLSNDEHVLNYLQRSIQVMQRETAPH